MRRALAPKVQDPSAAVPTESFVSFDRIEELSSPCTSRSPSPCRSPSPSPSPSPNRSPRGKSPTSAIPRALVYCFALAWSGCGTAPRVPQAPRSASAPAASIEWLSYGAAPFERARETGRLVLLSVKTQWCHWCHVMNETTYRDPRVAELVGSRFVAVLADADADPFLAERYGAWGWPATIVLDASGHEIRAMRGYRSPDAFLRELRGALDDPRPRDVFAASGPPSAPLDGLEAAAHLATDQLDAMYDEQAEGWGRPQKYPFTAPVLLALLRPDPWPERATRTMAQYVRLIDPVWGGMYQYSVRGVWDRPHYKRIASVQAGALEALAEVLRATGETRWRAAARDIVRFLRDFLRTPEGAFSTSMDADLRVEGRAPMTGEAYFALDDAGRRALGIPRVDPTPHASTQGMLAAGLLRLASALPPDDALRREATDLARAAIAFAELHHFDARRGLFRHAPRDASERWYLADQVAMLRARLAWQHVTGDPREAARARELAEVVERTFCDARTGCVSQVPREGPLRPRVPIEENGRLAQSLAAIADLTADVGFEERARAYLSAAADAGEIRRSGRIVGDFLLGALLLRSERPMLHVVGPADDPRTSALFEASLRAADWRTRVERVPPDASRYPYPGRPCVYPCSLQACGRPVSDAEQVAPSLAAFRRAAGES
ncbi:MAG: DUF255 domain-containing protein [Myxococcota bacterium]|nr:DUF255 domain-containing protein [Myxococcota bacterium]